MDSQAYVFQGRDNSGGAAVFPDRAPVTDKYFDFMERQGAVSPKEQSAADMALRKISADSGKGWSVDRETLQDELRGYIDKLKDYETTKNKSERRQKWYDAEQAKGNLEMLITKSQKNQSEFLRSSNEVKNDTRGSYDDQAWTTLDEYPKLSLHDRPDTPAIKKYSSQNAIESIVKNTHYAPKEKTVKTIQPDGTYAYTKRVILEEAPLRESIEGSKQTLAPNLVNLLKSDTRDAFLKANPEVLKDPVDVQEKKFNDYVTDVAYKAMENGYKNQKVDVRNLKQSDGKGLNLNFSGGVASNGKAIYTVKKEDEDGTYKISIEDVGKGSPSENKPMEFVLSGKEYKEISGDKDANIDDDAEMVIKGKLKYIQVNEDKGLSPMIAISYEDMVSGGPRKVENGSFVSADKFKRGQVFTIPYIDENKAVVLQYGSDPIDVYKQKRKQVDEEYKKRQTRSSLPAKSAGAPEGVKSKSGNKPEGAKYSNELLNALKNTK